MTAVLVVHLDAKWEARLDKPINGRGGFQDLLRHMRGRRAGNIVTLTERKQIERFYRYGLDYGRGGFQGRLGRA